MSLETTSQDVSPSASAPMAVEIPGLASGVFYQVWVTATDADSVEGESSQIAGVRVAASVKHSGRA